MKEAGEGETRTHAGYPWGSAPCIRQDRDGEQTGADAKAFVKLILSRVQADQYVEVFASGSP